MLLLCKLSIPDKLEWSFIKKNLELFDFPCNWRNLILDCISSSTLSILLNGEQLPMVEPSRGIRQGDLLTLLVYHVHGISKLANP